MESVYVPRVFPNTWRPNVELVVSYDDLVQYNKKYCYVPTFQDVIASIIGFVVSGSLVACGIYLCYHIFKEDEDKKQAFNKKQQELEEKRLSMLINKYAHVAPTFDPSIVPIPFQLGSR